MPQLSCQRCGVRYGEAAIVRQPTLASGAPCRRCGGTLEPHDADSSGNRGDAVVAVGSALSEADAVPFA
jgi:hypothetical protein